jgi:hypothetical protein
MVAATGTAAAAALFFGYCVAVAVFFFFFAIVPLSSFREIAGMDKLGKKKREGSLLASSAPVTQNCTSRLFTPESARSALNARPALAARKNYSSHEWLVRTQL